MIIGKVKILNKALKRKDIRQAFNEQIKVFKKDLWEAVMNECKRKNN